MTYQDIRDAQRAGKLRDYSLPQLREMSITCALWLQSGNKDDSHVKDSVDDEIRRKDAAEAEQRSASRDREKIEAIRNVDGKLTAIDGRLTTLEKEASRAEFRTWGFWFALFAVIISLAALSRDYWGWRSTPPATVSAPHSARSTQPSGRLRPDSPASLPARVLVPAQAIPTDLPGSNTLPQPKPQP